MITTPITNEGTGQTVPPAGPQGASAYDVAVQNGFIGSQSSWLASLQGPGADPTSLNAAVSRANVAATNAGGFAATASAAAASAAATLANLAKQISDATSTTVSAILASLQAAVTAAAGSATAAGNSATAAAGSATTAGTGATTATTQASATAAAGSATAAGTSATAASGSASAAATSATAASGSAGNAATAASGAGTSATAAGTSASAAATSATAAAGSAAAASASATTAAGSATTAGNAASSATAQASAASSSASSSSGSASAAATSATNAANSATAAAGSVTTAQNWAMQSSGTVDGTNYSAKYWAQQAATSASQAAAGGIAPSGTFVVGDIIVANNTAGTSAKDSGVALSALATATQVNARLSRAGDQATGALDLAPAVTVASAATTAIGAAASNFVQVTGTMAIVAFDAVAESVFRYVRFASPGLVLTHDATKMILPGAASITTQAGDHAIFRSLGSGNWRCVNYQRADGTALVSPTIASLGAASASDVNIAQQNLLYQGLLIAALRGVPTGIVDGILDPFSSLADINTAGINIPNVTPISGGDQNTTYVAANAFDGSNATQWGSVQTGSSANGAAFIGQDFGSAKTPVQCIIAQYSGQYSITSALVQYADSASGPWTTAVTAPLIVSAASSATQTNDQTIIAIPAGAGSHRYWRLLANSAVQTASLQWSVCELSFQSVTSLSSGYTFNSGAGTIGATPEAYTKLLMHFDTSVTADVTGHTIGTRYLPTGWCEATDAGWGGSKCNEGLRGVMKADSLMA